MERFQAGYFLRLAETFKSISAMDDDQAVGEEYRQVLSDVIKDSLKDVTAYGLRATAKSMQRALELASDPMVTHKKLGKAVEEIQGRLQDEMEDTYFLVVDSGKVPFYKGVNLFGDEVMAAFPSTAFDIEEAGKCLALHRSTACVFHLMRVLEAGLNALAADLAASFTRTNWQTVIDRIEAEIKKIIRAGPGPKASAKDRVAWKQRVEFCSETAVQFTYLKEAWRNRAYLRMSGVDGPLLKRNRSHPNETSRAAWRLRPSVRGRPEMAAGQGRGPAPTRWALGGRAGRGRGAAGRGSPRRT